MASFYKRKLTDSTVYEVKIRRKGYPIQMRSFDKEEDAKKWAREIESTMDRGVFRSTKEAEKTTLSAALDRYLNEVSKHKNLWDPATGSRSINSGPLKLQVFMSKPTTKKSVLPWRKFFAISLFLETIFHAKIGVKSLQH